MRRFRLYRPTPPQHYVKEGYANEADEVQLEGCVFTDGTVVVRWCTDTKSHSIWDSLDDFKKIHGHPEYGTEWVWLDK
jgi:hypothetical protein